MLKLFLYLIVCLSYSTSVFSEGLALGYHLDLRIQHKTADQLKSTFKTLSDMGYNKVIVEWEGTFPFKAHPGLQNAFAYSHQEIKEIHDYAKKLNLDLISQQQTLGHLEYVLMNDRYESLREDRYNLSQICPRRSGSLALVKELIQEMLDVTDSNYLHIGGDEARLLGHCKSCAKVCQEKSVEDLFGEYTAKVCQFVKDAGKTPVLWADMVLQHPEALDYLPEGTVLIDWNYGWKLDRFGPLEEMIKNKKVEFWGAAAIRSHPDNYFITDWARHKKNLHEYIPFSKKNFKALFLTSWATSGVYDYRREPSNHVIEIIPLRRTFPDVTMKFMKSAFIQMSKGDHEYDYVTKNLVDQFGIDVEKARLIWELISKDQKVIKGRSIEDKIKDVNKYLLRSQDHFKALNEIEVKSNTQSFEQLKLQLQTRVHYLKQRKIGFVLETKGMTSDLRKKIGELVLEAKEIDANYIDMFKHDYDLYSLKEDCRARNRNLSVLADLAK